MNRLDTALFQMYMNVRVGTNDTCRTCISAEHRSGRTLGKPISYWHVGDRFETDPYRIVFVGKNAVDGTELPLVGCSCHDASQRGAELYLAGLTPFWTYTEATIVQLFGVHREEALRRIAITNLVKCNHSTGKVRKDTASEAMKQYCISDLKVVWREMEILEPRTVVFYTHDGYDDHIANFRFGDSFRDITSTNHTLPVGKKTILWWHRTFFKQGKPVLHFLRTSHPERKNKEDFVQAVVGWLAQNRTV